jgi:O-methyltransferase
MIAILHHLFNGRQGESQVGETEPAEIVGLDRYSMSGNRVLQKLYRLGRDVVTRDIAGDFVECGVCNGGSAAAIACGLRSSGRRVWLYDSFQGVPKPSEIDGACAANFTGAWVGELENVKRAMEIAGVADKDYIVRAGWFKDTFRLPLPERVSILHIDADWYDSVLLSLNTFYDRVGEGGIVVLDDFGHWEGCREAFYDFISQRHLKPLLERFGHTQAFWVKGRAHNREFSGKWEIPD